MSKQNEKSNPEPFIPNSVQEGTLPAHEIVAGKKQFVEPEISTPVDVLEATTFFQGTDSGGPL